MNNYSRPISTGIVIILVFLLLQFLPRFLVNTVGMIIFTFSLILRLVVCYWIYFLTKQQGRPKIPFMLLALLIPAITLIIVGILGDRKITSIAD